MQFKFSLHFLIIAILLTSCSTEKNQKNQLDYSMIPLIELQKKFSITESEEYIPGQITNVMVTEDGHILVLQRREKSIHQFDSLGNHRTRVAGPGRGPGELSRNANPHFTGKFLIMSNNNGMFTEYRPNEEGIFEYRTDYLFRLPVQGYLTGIRSEDDFSEFYVNVDSVRIPFLTLPPEFTTDFIHLVRMDSDSIEVQEKILSLKRHSAYVEITDGGSSMTYNYLPYRYTEYFSPLPGGKLMVSRPLRSVIQVYDENFGLEHEVKLNVKDRPVRDEDFEYHFADLSSFDLNKRKKVFRDTKPPFMQVLLDDQNHFWLLTDETEEGKEYVILNYEGKPLGRVLTPAKSNLHAIRDGILYFINNEGESSVDVYEVDIEK